VAKVVHIDEYVDEIVEKVVWIDKDIEVLVDK
jgi:hypothetical protein